MGADTNPVPDRWTLLSSAPVRSSRVAAIVRAIKIISREQLARRLANQTGLFDLTTLSDGELQWLSDEFELLPGARAEQGGFGFALDSLLEETGFEPVVPLRSE